MTRRLLRLLAGISAVGVACALGGGGSSRGEEGALRRSSGQGARDAPTNALIYGASFASGYVAGTARAEAARINGARVGESSADGAEMRAGLKARPYETLFAAAACLAAAAWRAA